jgi:hypothetical protein
MESHNPAPGVRSVVRATSAVVAVLSLGLTLQAHAVPVVTSAAGPDAGSIQAAVDAFRASLGTLNPNVADTFVNGGRREINWDGVPDASSSPNPFPPSFFNIESPRGVLVTTPGTSLEVSASAASGTPVRFGNIDPTYPNIFTTFSAEKLFAPVGSNIVDVSFLAAGTASTGTVSGFGAVFTDVDLPNVSSMEFFDFDDKSLGVFSVPEGSGDGSLSFLGVAFSTERAARVRITAGDTSLALGATRDVVAMDDFIYGEPIPPNFLPAVPEPSTTALMVMGLGAMAITRRRRRPGS